jgi:hypothetical protein
MSRKGRSERLMGPHRNDEAQEAASSEADIVESGGETTAAATGTAEIGAATGAEVDEGSGGVRPVGADTMLKVAGETEPEKQG